MTILDLAPRLAARTLIPTQRSGFASVRHLGGATVTQLPDAATRRLRDTGIDSAIDVLSFLLIQADSFNRAPLVTPVASAGFAGQVQAYATSLGALAYPEFPAEAFAVKRDILAALKSGPLDGDQLRLLVLPDLDAPEAC